LIIPKSLGIIPPGVKIARAC